MREHMTYEVAHALLRYENGRLFWRTQTKNMKPDASADSAFGEGYLSVSHGRKRMSSHRVVWLLLKGKWPHQSIDHINGIRSDNRIENLRLCTRSQNMQNLTKVSSATGFKGVTFHKQTGKFQASIKIEGKFKYLGLFVFAKDAAKAYDVASVEAFGEFSLPNFAGADRSASLTYAETTGDYHFVKVPRKPSAAGAARAEAWRAEISTKAAPYKTVRKAV